MAVVYFILFLLAVVSFVLAAFGARFDRVNFIALGLAFGFAVFMIQQARGL